MNLYFCLHTILLGNSLLRMSLHCVYKWVVSDIIFTALLLFRISIFVCGWGMAMPKCTLMFQDVFAISCLILICLVPKCSPTKYKHIL